MNLLQTIDQFFMQQGSVYQTLENLARNLTRAGIDYAIVGGMALVLHGYIRTTQDVDILLSREGLAAFQRSLLGRGFVPAFPGATRMFRDSQTGVVVEVLVSGEFPGDGKPKPVAFPDPTIVAIQRDNIKVVSLTTLIELKLASGISALDRLKDLADVQELIRALDLPADLAEGLDASVRQTYLQLWSAIDQAKSNRHDWRVFPAYAKS